MKLQMAQFLQGTIEEMAVAGKNPKKRETVQEFAEFFEKVGFDPLSLYLLASIYVYCTHLHILFCA